jgi:hypothetical protein
MKFETGLYNGTSMADLDDAVEATFLDCIEQVELHEMQEIGRFILRLFDDTVRLHKLYSFKWYRRIVINLSRLCVCLNVLS